MERSLFRYIFQHTWRNQVLLLIVTAISFPLIYINLEIPKRIVNSAIGGKNIPSTFLGFDVTQVSYLMALSFLLLALITLNGVIKYWLNVYSGVIGERTMRRLRPCPLPAGAALSAAAVQDDVLRRDHSDDRRRDRSDRRLHRRVDQPAGLPGRPARRPT